MPWRDLDPNEVIWMRPKGWDYFQHYKDGRNVHWIKNYLEIDDPGSKFKKLSWADQGRLQALWRLSAKLHRDGLIPYDERYLCSALGDKRFPFGGQMVTTWFHIGTQKDLKTAAKRENRSRGLVQISSPEVRSKSKKPPTPLSVETTKPSGACQGCGVGGGLHADDCSFRLKAVEAA